MTSTHTYSFELVENWQLEISKLTSPEQRIATSGWITPLRMSLRLIKSSGIDDEANTT
jgi:hypothetical protein